MAEQNDDQTPAQGPNHNDDDRKIGGVGGFGNDGYQDTSGQSGFGGGARNYGGQGGFSGVQDDYGGAGDFGGNHGPHTSDPTPRDYLKHGPPHGHLRSDERIAEEVLATLSGSDLNASGVEILVSDGIVYLTGTVDHRGDRQTAGELVGGVRGVLDVTNDLMVA